MTPSNIQSPTVPRDSSLDFQSLKGSLDAAFSTGEDFATLYRRVVDFLISCTGAGAVSIGPCGSNDSREDVFHVTDAGLGWSPDLLKILQNGGRRTISRRQTAVARLSGKENITLFAVPVFNGSPEIDALCAAVDTSGQTPDVYIVILQLASQCLSLCARKSQNHGVPATDAALQGALHSSIATALEGGDRKKAGPVFVQKIKEYFQADVVMLAPGLEGVGGVSLLHSSISGFNEHSPQMKLVKQVVAECRHHGRSLTYKIESELPETLNSLLLRDMSVALFAAQSICFPLRSENSVVLGVLLVCWNKPQKGLLSKIHACMNSENLLAGFVSWIGQSQYVTLKKSLLNAKQRSLIMAAVLAGILLLGCLPVPFTVTGECVLEPKQTRFVVAQFDAILKRVYKLPGTTVKKGDLLAELDGRTIELEINSLLAEIQKTKKLQDVHTATGKAALAQMAGLERRGLEEQLSLYRERMEKLSLVSPVDGIVISETMERVEGGPISRGQGLFEIAPLGLMIAEANISQEDISYVKTGEPTKISLDSFPGKKWDSTISTIFPRSELRGGQYVFLVESPLENPEALYRPGMRGELSILVGKKPLAWKLFRKPWIYFQKTFLND